ncbi:MAG: pyrimidine reductase family protein [Acidimicrobiales bacterium]
MRQLLPSPATEVDLGAAYGSADRRPHHGRPWVVANFVSSADGSATLDGRSGPLGSGLDRRVFRLLRSLADVVLVGAGTVRAERYGPVRGPDPAPLAVVSASLDLDWQGRLFTDAVARPLVITGAASDPERRAHAAQVAEVVVIGEERVDLGRAVAALGGRGHRVVLCEGGPSVLGQLLAADALDELCLTLSPILVGGDGPRIASHAQPARPLELRPVSLLEEDGTLFLRYLRR